MIEYRDRLAREWGLNLVVGQNKEALAAGMNHTMGRVVCCTALKTNGLKQLLENKGYTGVILGVRADEEGTRAKERYFSPRDKHDNRESSAGFCAARSEGWTVGRGSERTLCASHVGITRPVVDYEA